MPIDNFTKYFGTEYHGLSHFQSLKQFLVTYEPVPKQMPHVLFFMAEPFLGTHFYIRQDSLGYAEVINMPEISMAKNSKCW
jgi:hypothetical protein